MKKLAILFLFTLTLVSCSNDDDNPTNPELDGVWNLMSVSCECEPGTFEVGEHLWNFNTTQNTISVANNPDEDMQILDDGVYDYIINNDSIKFDQRKWRFYFDNNDVLIIESNPEIDGPLLQLIR